VKKEKKAIDVPCVIFWIIWREKNSRVFKVSKFLFNAWKQFSENSPFLGQWEV